MNISIPPEELDENFIRAIGREFMLITAGTRAKFNTMTASWGGVGFLWNKPVAFVFVRPERYTYGFIQAREDFTISFLDSAHRDAYKICGTRSGRDTDKVSASGLYPQFTERGNPMFEEARLTLECRKLYSDMLKAENFLDKSALEKWYGGVHGGLHRLYVGEIMHVWVRESAAKKAAAK